METNERKASMLFTNNDIKKLIIPLMIEQFLTVFVGMADTVMVSQTGEAAISAVSLVDTVNVLLINIFAALANGGAVVAGQFLGHKNRKESCKVANQLLLFATLVSAVVMLLTLVFHNGVLHGIFGKIDAEVMKSAKIYLVITALSIPFIAIYNAGAALFRAMGNSKVTMIVTFIMNTINVAGNAILIFGFHMGVMGVAIPTTISRIVAAIIIVVMLFQGKREITLKGYFKLQLSGSIIKKILYIGVPNGLENSMFQLGKIVVLSLVATLGTSSIAANAVSNTIALFQIIPGQAIGMAMLSVTAQCVGAGDYEQVKYYNKKLVKITYGAMLIVNMIVVALLPLLIHLYHLGKTAASITQWIIIFHALCACVIWPLSFSLPNTLRAANDVKFCLILSVISMWAVRIAPSYILARNFGLGVKGIWIAMVLDWCVRAIFFTIHYKRENWIPKKQEV
ncbi:MAG: MATE family efflux transporter [Lachnospiraceae bacterium]|nr:MATE family efflux transporter [Lachnospiraceae bacterium]MEE1342694.1 MATE family efflux transporter [Lachnospiraceae bacterium]